MKRALLILIVLFLVACGNGYHKDINESLAMDTEQVIDIIESVIKEDREFTDKELDTIAYYKDHYERIADNREHWEDEDISELDAKLIYASNIITSNPEHFIRSASNQDEFDKWATNLKNIMKTGEHE